MKSKITLYWYNEVENHFSHNDSIQLMESLIQWSKIHFSHWSYCSPGPPLNILLLALSYHTRWTFCVLVEFKVHQPLQSFWELKCMLDNLICAMHERLMSLSITIYIVELESICSIFNKSLIVGWLINLAGYLSRLCPGAKQYCDVMEVLRYHCRWHVQQLSKSSLVGSVLVVTSVLASVRTFKVEAGGLT